MAGNRKVGRDRHSARLIELRAGAVRQHFAERRSLHARGPEHGPGCNAGLRGCRVLTVTPFSSISGHHGSGAGLDAEFDQRPFGRFRKFRRIRRQHAIRAFDQEDIGVGGIDAAEIFSQCVARDLAERARQFDAGRARRPPRRM